MSETTEFSLNLLPLPMELESEFESESEIESESELEFDMLLESFSPDETSSLEYFDDNFESITSFSDSKVAFSSSPSGINPTLVSYLRSYSANLNVDYYSIYGVGSYSNYCFLIQGDNISESDGVYTCDSGLQTTFRYIPATSTTGAYVSISYSDINNYSQNLVSLTNIVRLFDTNVIHRQKEVYYAKTFCFVIGFILFFTFIYRFISSLFSTG